MCLFLQVLLTASAPCLGPHQPPDPVCEDTLRSAGVTQTLSTCLYSVTVLEHPSRLQTSEPRASICPSLASWPWEYKPVLFSSLTPRCIFYAGFVEQLKSFKHVTKSYPPASAAFFSCSSSLTAYLLSLRTRGCPRRLPQHPEDWQVRHRRSTHACPVPRPCGFAGAPAPSAFITS